MGSILLDALFTRWGIGLYAIAVVLISMFFPGVVFITIGLFALLIVALWRFNLETALGLLPFEVIAFICGLIGLSLSPYV